MSYLITGAGSGFGKEVALRLAEAGEKVIAAVEIEAQVFALEEEAKKRGAKIRVVKLDITEAVDRERAADWDVEVLLNNAGISEGGAVADIPEEQIWRQFDVNVFGPVLLTQVVARKMVERGRGRIVFVSSVAGLTVDPFAGAYSASKHAIEAFAEALYKELAEFNIEVATINPGPFLTGFNDRMFETWKYWQDDPSKRVFDYSKISFPHEQYDPEPVYETTVKVLRGEIKQYRNVEPKEIIEDQRKQLENAWTRKVTDGLGERHPLVQKAYEIKPGTPNGK